MKRVFQFLAAAVVLVVIAAGVAYAAMNRFLDAPVNVDGDAIAYEVKPGAAFTTVANDLAEAGVIDRPDWWRWYARITGQAQQIRAGEFDIAAGTTARELLQKFVDGDVRLYSFTIVEGLTFRAVLAAMADSGVVVPTLNYDDWPTLLESLGSSATHPEGLFLPETYRFPRGTTDVDLLGQAYAMMQETLTREWSARAVGLPLDEAYDALILASIIEKETAKADERATISGVFVRRMQKGMRLQTDPTVIYGIGESFDGNLTRRHLRTDTPYNTYTRHGLPPTPIALPGQAAIHAALHPEDGSALYFVATGLGDGGHVFSDTKDQHDAAVREYVARQRAARNAEQGAE